MHGLNDLELPDYQQAYLYQLIQHLPSKPKAYYSIHHINECISCDGVSGSAPKE